MVDPRIDELVAMVRRLEQRLGNVQGPQLRFDVALDANSGSNFYRGLDGNDVVAHGGLFVESYAKLPPLGAPVTLGLSFPGGARADVTGVVAFVQEYLGDDTPAGFGARLTNVSLEAHSMIAAFARERDPLVR